MYQENNVIQFPQSEGAEGYIVGVDLANGEDQTVIHSEKQPQTFDIVKARKLFGIQDNMKAVQEMRNDIIQRKVSVLSNKEAAQKLDEKLESYSVDQLKAMDDNQIAEIYQMEDGEIEFTLDFNGDKAKELDFKRSFLIYIKESSSALDEIDKEMAKLEESLKEDQEEFNRLVAEFGSLSAYIEADLHNQYETATGARKEKLGKMIGAYENALTLENIVEHYKKFNTSTTISDMYHRSADVYARYMKVLKQLKVTTDLTQFDKLELKFLEEKYHVHPNLLLFAIIKYIAYKKDKADRSIDGIFLSQLAVNVRALFTNNFETQGKKERFLQGARKVLDLFI